MKVGAADSGADVGPLISARAVKALTGRVSDAVAAGGRIVAQAAHPTHEGFFFPPTVIADVPRDHDLITDEIFGPVAPITAWDDLDELVTRLNRSDYGLAAYVFAGNHQDAMRVAEQLDVGMVAINRGLLSDPSAPFGGTKHSGLGREGGRHGLEEFTETKYLSLDWPQPPPRGSCLSDATTPLNRDRQITLCRRVFPARGAHPTPPRRERLPTA